MGFILSFEFVPLEMIDLNRIDLKTETYLISDKEAKELKEYIETNFMEKKLKWMRKLH